MKYCYRIVSFTISILVFIVAPITVSAIGVSPGKIDLGYVLPSTTTTIQLNLSRGSTNGLKSFLISAHGNGANALSLQKKIIPFTNEEDSKKISVSFRFDHLKSGEYEPYLEITPLLENTLDIGSAKTLPSLKVSAHFTITTTPYSNISSYPVSLYFLSPSILKINSEIQNNGTDPAIVQGAKIKFLTSKKIFTLFFDQAIIIPPKTKKTIDQRTTTSPELFMLNDISHFAWLLPNREQTATATVIQKYITQKKITHTNSTTINFLLVTTILLFSSSSAILYTIYRKKYSPT